MKAKSMNMKETSKADKAYDKKEIKKAPALAIMVKMKPSKSGKKC